MRHVYASALLCVPLAGCGINLLDSAERAGLYANATTDARCKNGLSPAETAAASVSQLLIDGVYVYAELVPGATYDGVPAACTSEDELETSFILEASGAPVLWLTMKAPAAGSFSLLNGTAGIGLEIEASTIDQASTFTVGPTDLTDGALSVTGGASASSWTLAANGYSDAHTLRLSGTFDATAPAPAYTGE
jgi:hypothetical protein